MKNDKIRFYAILATLIFIVIIAATILSPQMGDDRYIFPRKMIVDYSGGSAMLIQECADKNYIENISMHIIEGMTRPPQSVWGVNNEIITFTDIRIVYQLKGTFPVEIIRLETAGGTVGNITQEVEDQPVFQPNQQLRLYLQENNGQFSIVCGNFGVEEISSFTE